MSCRDWKPPVVLYAGLTSPPLCARVSFTAQAAHLAELHLGETDLDVGEQQFGQAISLESDLDLFLAGVQHVKQVLLALSEDPGAFIAISSDHGRTGRSKS